MTPRPLFRSRAVRPTRRQAAMVKGAVEKGEREGGNQTLTNILFVICHLNRSINQSINQSGLSKIINYCQAYYDTRPDWRWSVLVLQLCLILLFISLLSSTAEHYFVPPIKVGTRSFQRLASCFPPSPSMCPLLLSPH